MEIAADSIAIIQNHPIRYQRDETVPLRTLSFQDYWRLYPKDPDTGLPQTPVFCPADIMTSENYLRQPGMQSCTNVIPLFPETIPASQEAGPYGFVDEETSQNENVPNLRRRSSAHVFYNLTVPSPIQPIDTYQKIDNDELLPAPVQTASSTGKRRGSFLSWSRNRKDEMDIMQPISLQSRQHSYLEQRFQ